MTPAQQRELDRAIERAQRFGIEVTAHGRRKSDGKPIYCTNSHSHSGTTQEKWHIVTLLGHRLACDCPSRLICCHRAAVHLHLVNQAAKKLEQALEVEMGLEDEAEGQARTDERAAATAPLYRDNDAVGIWKH